ncbi:MAG: GGDEF domain-containing protein [Acidimicrobiales bacterium]
MAESQLQASTDGLTGLANRRAFDDAFLQLRDRSPHAPCVIAMADLDRFKAINDTYGHETGDRALRVFADTLRSAVRANDLVARRGGEEFALALPDCDTHSATEVLERVRLHLQRAIKEAGLPSFTASFGMTPGFLAEDLDLLLARADAGLSEAKRGGRYKIVAFSAADLDGASERAALLAPSDALLLMIPVMERHPRLGLPMSLDEVGELLGWNEADRDAHFRALDDRPAPELDEVVARIAARSSTR